MSGSRSLEADHTLLAGVDRSAYAEIWCALNRGDWDDRIPVKPDNYDSMDRNARHDFIWPIMEEIMGEITFKKCLREWNKDNMDDEEFESFWRGRRF